MKIREMKLEDVENLKEFPTLGYGTFGSPYELLDLYSYTYVAEENDKLVGFLFAGRSDGNIVILWALEVLPQYQKKGIARALHDRLIEDMKQCGDTDIFLFFNREDNLNEFYEDHLGYEIGHLLVIAHKGIVDA